MCERVPSKKCDDDYSLSCFNKTDVYETCCEDKGELFKSLVKAHGRCVSKIYLDTEGKPKEIGWVFLKKEKYEDSPKTYLQETWVTLYSKPPTKTTEYYYL